MWVGLASILMLFMALTSAYILRQTKGLSEFHDWVSIQLPGLLWVTTGSAAGEQLHHRGRASRAQAKRLREVQ